MIYRFVLVAWVTCLNLIASTVAEAVVIVATVDDFSVESQSVSIAPGAIGSDVDSSAVNVAILGGTRTIDLSLTVADPIRPSTIDVFPGSARAEVSFAGSAAGNALFGYSPVAGNLLAGGADSLVISTTVSAPSTLSISIVDTLSNVATESFMSTVVVGQEIVLPFADFSNAGSVSFDSVQTLEISFSSVGGMAIALDSISTGAPIPEPGVGGLLAVTLVSISLRRTRKRSRF